MGVAVITKEEIEKAVANVAATMRVEGLEQSPGARKISTDYLAGILSSQDAINKIKQLHGF